MEERPLRKSLVPVLAVSFGLAACIPHKGGEVRIGHFERQFVLDEFHRGNTHTHTRRSDGDSPAREVVKWYRDRDYQFVVITDHNQAGPPGEFSDLEVAGEFVAIAGEELSFSTDRTDRFERRSRVSVHVNSLCSAETAGGGYHESAAAALQEAVDRVRAQPGAVAQINHPNYEWALKARHLRAVEGAPLLEVANQHFHVRNGGDTFHDSVEELWDELLSSGKRYYGVASDDMHDLHRTREELGYPPRRGGLGWVEVALGDSELSAGNICSALARGDFYSSTGVELSQIRVTPQEMMVLIRPAAGTHAHEYTTTFIGQDGSPLTRSPIEGDLAVYRLRGDEGYVRARIDGPDGAQAWVQPVFVRSRSIPLTP